MKTGKRIFRIYIIVIISGMAGNLFAQKNLEAVKDKLQQGGKDQTRLSQRIDSETEQEVIETLQITIKENKKMIDELQKAFESDRKLASSVFEKEENGHSSIYYKFDINGKKHLTV